MELGQVVMTVAIAQYGLIPPIADLNRSHALNPDWPPHARFHVTAQVATTSLIALGAAAILWLPGLDLGVRGNLAALASAAVLGGFFAGVLASRWVGGAIAAPGAARLGGLDAIVLNFGVSALLTLAGRLPIA